MTIRIRFDHADGIWRHLLTNLNEMRIEKLNFFKIIVDEVKYRRICIIAICFFMYFMALIVFFTGVGL